MAASAVLAVAVAGCGTAELFGEHGLPESPDVAAAPWPRLVDVPEAPPVGIYTADVPDPAEGARTQVELAAAATAAGARAAELAGPPAGPLRPSDAAMVAAVNAARARAAALSGPVIDPVVRAALLERARLSR